MLRGVVKLHYSKAMRMRELKVQWVSRLQFLPQLPDAEVSLANVRVVKQDNCAWGELGQPGFEIPPDGVVGVESVDVQERYRRVREVLQGIVERHPQEPREFGVMLLLISADASKDTLVVMARMLIPLPGIHGIASRGNP